MRSILSDPQLLFPKEPPSVYRGATAAVVLTASAREAWGKLLEWYAQRGGGSVLLPAYIGYTDKEGSGVFDPVRDAGLDYRFYPVDDQLFTPTDYLLSEFQRGGVGVLLIVHWFGLPHVNLEEVRGLCDQFDVLLVEDCAHVLGVSFQEGALGQVGDAAFYSLHKTYGGRLGGMLAWNLSSTQMGASPFGHSSFLEVVGQAFSTNGLAIAQHRRMVYKLLVDGLSGVEGLRIMFPDIGDNIPQSLAVQVGGGLRESLYFSLLQKGIPLTALYYRLIPEINILFYPDGFSVSQNILNFPVHQGVPIEIVPRIIDMTLLAMTRLRT
jgi:hypothetical protein